MVCAKCQKLLSKTELATPGVKRKQDIYYGSPTASASGSGTDKSKTSATLGNTGVGKVCYISLVPNMQMLILNRANFLVRVPKTLMQHILAHVQLARQRRSKEERIVRGAPTRRIVGPPNPSRSPLTSLTPIYSMPNVREKLEQDQPF